VAKSLVAVGRRPFWMRTGASKDVQRQEKANKRLAKGKVAKVDFLVSFCPG